MTEMEKSKYVKAVFKYQNLIQIKIKYAHPPYSEAQIANLSDNDLVKYYIRIELRLDKIKQEAKEATIRAYANKDIEIDSEPFEIESLNLAEGEKDTFLGPECPSPHADIIEGVRKEIDEKNLRLIRQREEEKKK